MRSPLTLRDAIYFVIVDARAQGYTGPSRDYELTTADCDAIVRMLGRKPTRDEWAAAGYKWVGSDAHVSDE